MMMMIVVVVVVVDHRLWLKECYVRTSYQDRIR